MNDDDLQKRKILLTLPDGGCDLCGERAALLELIGGKKGRTWICHKCKKETEVYLYTTPEGREMLKAILAKARDTKREVEERKEVKEELQELQQKERGPEQGKKR